MKNKSGTRWSLLLPLIPVLLGLLLLVLESPAQRALRNLQFDQFQRWHPRVAAPAPVLVVDIDEASLSRLGQWPWPRTRMAQLLDTLEAAGTAAVGFDVMFPEPDRTTPREMAALWNLEETQRAALLALPDHDSVFARSLERSHAVLGFSVLQRDGGASQSALPVPATPATPIEQKGRFVFLGEGGLPWLHAFDSAVLSLPAFTKAAPGQGALTFVPDGDGVVRRVPLAFSVAAAPVGTLVSETLRVAQGARNVMLKAAGHGSGLEEIRIGDATIPTTPQGEMWLHYRQPDRARYVPAWKVLAGEVPASQLEGQLVLVGSSAQGLMDLRFSPMGLIPGVESHAQALEQVVTGHFLQRPSWARGLESVLLMGCGLVVGWLALRTRALVSAAAAALLLAGIAAASWWAFVAQRLLLDAATPAIGVLLTYVLCSLWHHRSSEQEQRWIKEAFSRYVSPNRVDYLVSHPDDMALGGQRQTCSFIFTDLAGFTGLMERMDPAQAVSLLNDYLDGMVAIAFRHEGTLDRIVGDAVAIMFSAPVPQPDHRKRALACALEMDAFANDFAARLQSQGIAFGHTRIGVHAGEVIVGNFGGSTMFDYRALGDPVNTAARLESVNKHLGTRLCVSEDILQDSPDAPVRPVGRLVLKGKSHPLAVFEPVTGSDDLRAPLEEYRRAWDALHQEDPQAASLFSRLAQDWPQDPLVRLHHQRLQAGERGDLIVMTAK